MRYFILLVFIAVIGSCDTENNFETPGEKYFVKFYGEDGDHEGVDFVSMSDGSFILLGNQKVVGATLGQQIYLVRVDAQGMVVWQKVFGSIGDDIARDIKLTSDGKIIIAAESQKGPQDRDVYVKIVSVDGLPLDSIRVGLKTITNLEADEEVNSISVIQSGFIVAGSTTAVTTQKTLKPNDIRDALHLRFNNTLDLVDPTSGLWVNSTGEVDSDDVLIKMFEINSSTYYGFGYTNTLRNSKRDYKHWAFSLGATGVPSDNGRELLDIIGSPLEDEILSSVIESPIQSGEGFVLNGVKTKVNGESQSFIVKLQKKLFVPGEDNVLNEESPTDLGNLENVDKVESRVAKQTRMTSLSQGGYLLLTNSKVLSNDKLNLSLIKLSNSFLKVWQAPVFFGGEGDDFTGCVTELPDGKIMIIGTMTLGGITGQTKMVFIKLNPQGRLAP